MQLVSFNAHTFAGYQECSIARATLAIMPGEKVAHRRLYLTAANLPLLSLAAAVTAAEAASSRASFRFPSLVVGNDLNLGERWAEGAFRAGDRFSKQCLHLVIDLKLEGWFEC